MTPEQEYEAATRVWAQMYKASESLLEEALESLERVECQFWACEGPTLEPIDMLTCHRCATVARLRRYLRVEATR